MNQVLREVLADELERLADRDPRLALLTITEVACEPDLRHATVLLDSLGDDEAEALAAVRVRLQAAVARQVRLKRTPQLSFCADPAVAAGQRVEAVLREIRDRQGPERPGAGGARSGMPGPERPGAGGARSGLTGPERPGAGGARSGLTGPERPGAGAPGAERRVPPKRDR